VSRLLTTGSVLMCPHGGSVKGVTSNTRVNAAAAPVLRFSDTFTITGCPFNPGTAHPCVSVRWISHTLRSKVSGDFTLSADSVGLCLAGDQAPQGTVLVVATQPQVTGT
jgi:hypothetical protein